jgi:hypothetical protein
MFIRLAVDWRLGRITVGFSRSILLHVVFAGIVFFNIRTTTTGQYFFLNLTDE